MNWKEEKRRWDKHVQKMCGYTKHEWVDHDPDQDQISKYKRCKHCGKIERK